jgi:RND superfamily putative drug exporter
MAGTLGPTDDGMVTGPDRAAALTMHDVGIFERLGDLVHRHRIAMIVVWVGLLVPAAVLAPSAASKLRAGGFTLPDLESVRARQVLTRELGIPASAVVVVLHSDTMVAGSSAFEAAAATATAGIPDAPYVAGYQSHLATPRQVSADGHTAYDIVALDLAPDDSPEALPGIEARLGHPPALSVALAGGPAFYGDIQTVSEADLQRAELVSLPLAMFALVIVFGSPVAAGVPLAVGGSAVLIALAAIGLVASAGPMSIFVLNLATLLGLGLAVDYSLLVVSRYREELGRRAPALAVADRAARDRIVAEAIRVTQATAGRAVFFSGLTVLLGLSGLLLFDFMVLRSVGIAGVIVVALSALAALTLLPAVLSVIGTRIDALAVRRLDASPSGQGRWATLARWVMARPVLVMIPTLTLLVALGMPFLSVRLNAPDATILPASVPSRAAYDLLARQFGEGEFAPLEVAVRTKGPVTNPANVAALFEWSRRLAADQRIVGVDSLVDVDPRITLAQYQLLYGREGPPPDRFAAEALAATTRGELTFVRITTPYGPNHPEARALVRELRDPASTLAPPDGTTVLIGGGAADVEDVVSRMAAEFPRTGLYILITTYGVLFVLLRSVVLPAKALVMNSLSILASFGALVWIFQWGNLSAVLGFRPLGFVETTLPVILFCVLFGLSMDYEVFLLSRMREIWDRGHDNEEAVAGGLERSGRIVTSAALIVVLVAGSFAFAGIVLIKAIGLGIAIAVALDATIVRALLVPATMRLLGRWNWWLPARLERWATVHLPPIEPSVARGADS